MTTGLQLRSLVKSSGELELSLAEVPVPELGADDILVRVQATPINPSDLGLLIGPADLSTAKVSGTQDRPVVTAKIPDRFMPAMAARADQSLPVGNEGAGEVIAAGASPAAQALLGNAWARLAKAKTSAEQASQAKSDFLATMSHEIRTPLNGVLGMAQVMQADELSPTQAERLRLIRRSGETLLSILNDVLDLSKIEEGQLGLEAEQFDLEHCTRGAVATFTALAETKNLAFDFAIDAEAKGSYLGDTVRLRQVVYNLVSNAVKFTETGGVAVRVSWRDGWLSVAVQDTGVGIALDQIERLFEKFTQGDGSTTRRHGGTGLGLSICRQLAELMGGRIEVRSEVGKGSTFTLTAPMERLKAPVSGRPAADDGEARPIRVLAAEDNPVNQMVLRTLLAQAGLEPTIVDNGAAAVEAWRSGAWDVILMDIQMPVMDGVAATREIRAGELEGARPRTPIIAVTANAMAHQVKDYLAAGIDLVAPKPIDATRLFEAMEQVLSAADEAQTRAA